MRKGVNTAIDAKLPEAIQGRSTVIEENILQFMTLEVDGRIADRTAHFATHDALASVDGRVAAVQAELASFQNQVATVRKEPLQTAKVWNDHGDDDQRTVKLDSTSRSHREIRAAGTRELSKSSEDSSSSGTAELSDDSSSLGKYSEPLIRALCPAAGRIAQEENQRAKGSKKKKRNAYRKW